MIVNGFIFPVILTNDEMTAKMRVFINKKPQWNGTLKKVEEKLN